MHPLNFTASNSPVLLVPFILHPTLIQYHFVCWSKHCKSSD